MDDPGTMELLERFGAVERDGESWRITEAGLAMADALATTIFKSGNDGINFDYGAWQKANKAFDHAAYNAKSKAVDDEAFGDGKSADLSDWMSAHERIMKDAPRPPFKPNAFYNKHGDGIQVYLCDDESYTQWLCPGVEVIRTFSDKRIIGFNVWGLSHIVADGGGELRKLPDEDERCLTVKALWPPGMSAAGKSELDDVTLQAISAAGKLRDSETPEDRRKRQVEALDRRDKAIAEHKPVEDDLLADEGRDQ